MNTVNSGLSKLYQVAQDDRGCYSRRIEPATLVQVYGKLNHNLSKGQVDDVIWEVNDRLDRSITWDEYMAYYQRCKEDTTGLEPMDFYYLGKSRAFELQTFEIENLTTKYVLLQYAI